MKADTLAANEERAKRSLARFAAGTVPHFIAGERVSSQAGATFETLDPTTNERQCTVASGEAADVHRAATAP